MGLSSVIDCTCPKNMANIWRENVLDGGIRCFNRNQFNPAALLDIHFVGELGYDSGGPMREFMRLAMKNLLFLPIFEGQETSRLLTLDYPCKSCQLPPSSLTSWS